MNVFSSVYVLAGLFFPERAPAGHVFLRERDNAHSFHVANRNFWGLCCGCEGFTRRLIGASILQRSHKCLHTGKALLWPDRQRLHHTLVEGLVDARIDLAWCT